MMNHPNSEITDMILNRNRLLHISVDDLEVDQLSNQIIQQMTDDFNYLDCDFILESLTELGYSPQLLNNDEGEWYITDCGSGDIIRGMDQDNTNYLTCSFINCDIKWSENIREAIQKYLNKLK